MRLYNIENSSSQQSTPTLTKSQPNLFTLSTTTKKSGLSVPENKRYQKLLEITRPKFDLSDKIHLNRPHTTFALYDPYDTGQQQSFKTTVKKDPKMIKPDKILIGKGKMRAG